MDDFLAIALLKSQSLILLRALQDFRKGENRRSIALSQSLLLLRALQDGSYQRV